MLALIREPLSKVGFLDPQTIYALVAPRDLVQLFTLIERRDKAISPDALLKIAVQKIVSLDDLPHLYQRRRFHTLFLDESPSARVNALSRILEQFRNRAITWNEFKNRYRGKHWPQIIEDLAKSNESDELANIAAGILIAVLTTRDLFDDLRHELLKLGALNAIDAIRKFSEYIEELNETEQYTFDDLKRIVGKPLRRAPLSHTISDDTSFAEPEVKNLVWPRVRLFTGLAEGQYSEAVPESISPPNPQASETHHIAIEQQEQHSETTADESGIRLGDASSSMPLDLSFPEIDEKVDWKHIRQNVMNNVEESFLELKRDLRLDDDDFKVRFIRCFIGLANLCIKHNQRGLIVVGTGQKQKHNFLDDASYQEFIEGYIRPKPRFVFKHSPDKREYLGVFIIHPVGRRPFVVNQSIRSRNSEAVLKEGKCFLREGTRTKELNEDETFDLMRDIALRYR